MFEIFTERARKVMSLARQEAQRMDADYIGTEHMLLAIVQENGGVAAKVLKDFNFDLKRLRQELEKLVKPSGTSGKLLGQLPFSPRAKNVIEMAKSFSSRFGHDVVGTEHLLVALMNEQEGIAYQATVKMGLQPEELQDRVIAPFGLAGPTHASSEAGPESTKVIPAGVALTWEGSVASEIVDTWYKISGGQNHDLLKSMIVAALERSRAE